MTHERGGLRGGTLDTPAIVAFAAAIENYQYELQHYETLRNYFENNLPETCQIVECKQQLPNICGGVMMEKVEGGQYVLLKLNEAGICISTGSACDIHSESGTKAILSMGFSFEAARQFFRISFGPSTTLDDIAKLKRELANI